MARDINKRLSQLNTRRRGLDRTSTLSMDAQIDILTKSLNTEAYQQRSNQPYTKYALGSMQEVGPDYTRIGLEEADRVGNQLQKGLERKQIYVAFELQGSVPLNVHIRGVSDVDLLTLETAFVTYDGGARSQAGLYTPITYTIADKMRQLRSQAENVLSDAFPAAEVDKSGNKAIKISGGSLRRPVDVVPSHWHDTTDWQSSQQKHDRGVKIFDKGTSATFLNMPFRHIKLIHERDQLVQSGLRKTIRLCKNVKADAENDGKDITVSSYDIAGLMWHCDLSRLIVNPANELQLLMVTQQHLDFLSRNIEYAKSLAAPDGSRFLLDSAAKVNGLVALSTELDDLAIEVAKEQSVALQYKQPTWQDINETLRKSYVPVH
jgi:hypothetical protein